MKERVGDENSRKRVRQSYKTVLACASRMRNRA